MPYVFVRLVIMRRWVVKGERPGLFVCGCVFLTRPHWGRLVSTLSVVLRKWRNRMLYLSPSRKCKTLHIVCLPIIRFNKPYFCPFYLQHQTGPAVQPGPLRPRKTVQTNPQRESDAGHQEAARYGEASFPPQLSSGGYFTTYIIMLEYQKSLHLTWKLNGCCGLTKRHLVLYSVSGDWLILKGIVWHFGEGNYSFNEKLYTTLISFH